MCSRRSACATAHPIFRKLAFGTTARPTWVQLMRRSGYSNSQPPRLSDPVEGRGNTMRLPTTFTLAVIGASILLHHAAAQNPPPGVPGPSDTWKLPDRDAMNAGTVTVITAPAGGATSVFGSDMARVLDDNNLRVLPILGKGPVHNVIDIINLKAVDNSGH